ncbi:4-alpha-glucanotransferase [Chondromyces crocatus]|uniref:4-alpha-glucanotransferase n=1 Tax=Chondromyces crocatus TaxID=52 RepID=A0A0K1ENI9_CHOCO|nr:4-alpha-glucanotransferase [Chondromyces crocatus]AKT42202.1 4-alpha-glucanotransferase [Chondromyces crocatus]
MTVHSPETRREAGILLHPTSLPGPHGIGDLGRAARHFVDWLCSAGLSLWQVLPLGPTDNDAPYMSWSALAGNPLLVDLAALREAGLLDDDDLRPTEGLDHGSLVDYAAVRAFKEPRLAKAARKLLSTPSHPLAARYQEMKTRESWLLDAALFSVLRRQHGGIAWWDWATPLRDRDPQAIEAAKREHAEAIEEEAVALFFFEHQWAELRRYCNDRGVRIVGDIPIYVDRNSADVWTHRDLFFLDENGLPTGVAGVPPDYFSELGQLWGNPLYRWERMAKNDFAWWRTRLGRTLAHADVVRIDHFRGLASYWEIPFGAPDARGGRWVEGPGMAFFEAIERHEGRLPLIAEDLGMIDQEVLDLRHKADLPGMRVLHFAFGGGADNTHLPHHHTEDSVVYPGTHDNDTTVGWWRSMTAHVRTHTQVYLRVSGDEIHWDMIRTAFSSVGRMAIVAFQDVLGLGGEARMNNPAVPSGNWRFRLTGDPFRQEHAARLRDLAEMYDRIPRPRPEQS